VPAQDGVGRDDDQHLRPADPDPGQAGPEQAVGRAELRAGRRSLIDGELLAQGRILESELAVAADEEGEEPEQAESEGDHGPRLWPDGADRSITCRADDILARDNLDLGVDGPATSSRAARELGPAFAEAARLPP
jgi:hypothetical protein